MNVLKTLLSAIAVSVADAQANLESRQISNLMDYFIKDEEENVTRPRALSVMLNSMAEEGESNKRDTYNIPYLSILPHNVLQIEKTEIDFSVALKNITEPDDNSELKKKYKIFQEIPHCIDHNDDLPELLIDVNGSWGKQKGLRARVKMIVGSSPVPEGAMRFVDEITKTNQGY